MARDSVSVVLLFVLLFLAPSYVSSSSHCREKVLRKIPATRKLVISNSQIESFQPNQTIFIYSADQFVGSTKVGSIYAREIYSAPLSDKLFESVKQGYIVCNLPPEMYSKLRSEAKKPSGERNYGPGQADDSPGSHEKKTEVSLHRANLFPEDYLGQRLLFDKIWISGVIEKDFHCIAITGKDGTYVDTNLSNNKLTFVLSEEMAEKLKDSGFLPHFKYKARITCRVERAGSYFIATINSIDFYGSDERIHTTITDNSVISY